MLCSSRYKHKKTIGLCPTTYKLFEKSLTKNFKKSRNSKRCYRNCKLGQKDHLLPKIDKAIDFTYIYEITQELYCHDNGRPAIDPVILFKMVLIQHIYSIASLCRTVAEIEMNMAYRWFLGIPLNEKVPHFATISYNFKNRFTEETIEKIFRWILKEIERAGYLSPEVVFVDATHIKANAALKKRVKNESGNKMKTVKNTKDVLHIVLIQYVINITLY